MTTGVYTYQSKKSQRGYKYAIKYIDGQHKQHMKRGFERKIDAERELARIKAEIAASTYIDPAQGKVRLSALGTSWLTGRKGVLKPSSYTKDESVWRNWVEPQWGQARIDTIRRGDIQLWVSAISEKTGAGTVQYALSVLRQILDLAVDDKRLASNPCKGVKVPQRHTEKRRIYLTMDQLAALGEEADRRKNKYGTLVLLMGLTGLRIGEASALRVRDIDFAKARIHVRENAVWTGGKLHVGTLKNGQDRIVPYPKGRLESLLKAAVAYKDGDALVFERPGALNDGRSLTDADYMRPPDARTGWFTTAVKHTDGVDDHMTLHDLRHTAVSLAIHNGAQPKLVQRIAGHKTFSITMETYADLYDADLDAFAEAMDYGGGVR